LTLKPREMTNLMEEMISFTCTLGLIRGNRLNSGKIEMENCPKACGELEDLRMSVFGGIYPIQVGGT